LTTQDKEVAQFDTGISTETAASPGSRVQIGLHLIEQRLERREILAAFCGGDFLGGLAFVVRTDVSELRDVVVGGSVDAEFGK